MHNNQYRSICESVVGSKINVSLHIISLQYGPPMQSFLVFNFSQNSQPIHNLEISKPYNNFLVDIPQLEVGAYFANIDLRLVLLVLPFLFLS